jgi:hypothetical protein
MMAQKNRHSGKGGWKKSPRERVAKSSRSNVLYWLGEGSAYA